MSKRSEILMKDRDLPVNTYKEALHVCELDQKVGYNFLKKCVILIDSGIFQLFECQAKNKVLIVSNRGDLYEYDYCDETLKLLQNNPNNIGKYKTKAKCAEIFDRASRIGVCFENGEFIVYQVEYGLSNTEKLQVMESPFERQHRRIEVNHGIGNSSFGETWSMVGNDNPSNPNNTLGKKGSIGEMVQSRNLNSRLGKQRSFEQVSSFPIAVIGSGEDSLNAHRNLISTELIRNRKRTSPERIEEQIGSVFELLSDVNVSREYIRGNLRRVGGLWILRHPMGHELFFKENLSLTKVALINNSKIDTPFRRILPFKNVDGPDELYLLGENGIVLYLKFDENNSPITEVFEGDF